MNATKWLSLSEIATAVGGTVHGDSALRISAVCSLEEPVADALSFSKETVPARLKSLLAATPVKAFLLSKGTPAEAIPPECAAVLVPDPLAAMVQVIALLQPQQQPSGKVSPRAEVHPTATLGAGVTIDAFAVIGEDAVIEDGAHLYPHVVIYPRAKIGAGAVIHSGAVIREECEVGAHAIVHNGAVIGADGFGYFPGPSRSLVKVPQIGRVLVGAHVEIGANSCVDRATLGTTVIGNGSKLDNLVQVGHNTKIGRSSIVCGQTGIAGSCTIGDGVVLGGGVGVKDHVDIVSGVRCGARSGVTSDLREPGDYAGFPAIKASVWRRQQVQLAKIPEVLERVELALQTAQPQKPATGAATKANNKPE